MLPAVVALLPRPFTYYGHDRRFGPFGDADRDGIPNRFERFPYNPRRY